MFIFGIVKVKKIGFHILDKTFGRNIKVVANKAKIPKKVSAHTFRHSYTTYLLKAGFKESKAY